MNQRCPALARFFSKLLGELRAFETTLLASRRADAQLAAWLNEPTGKHRAWVKDRNDELIPIYMLGEHLALSDTTRVLWQDRPDFLLTHAHGDEPFEVTTTAPQWFDDVNHGHQRAIEGELRNKGVTRIGHGFSRDQVASPALGRVTAMSSGRRTQACVDGLVAALERKGATTFDTIDCTLLVYCDGFGVQTIDGEFPVIAERAAASVSRPPFARIVAIHEHKYDAQYRDLGFQDLTQMAWGRP